MLFKKKEYNKWNKKICQNIIEENLTDIKDLNL